ncbi:homoserine dehydrogenase [Candidatus Neomarinimicrobiota bacterium]
MDHRLAIIGFGTVGRGLAEILLAKGPELRQRHGIEFSVVAVSDLLLGSVYNEEGLDLGQLLDLANRQQDITTYPDGIKGWDSLRVIRESQADTVVEATYTDLKTGEPALSHFKAAFESGKHLVTTNKGPVALRYRELAALAAERGVRFLFEGTVMSGTPVLNLARLMLAGATLNEISGILNGTTNYILTEMEQDRSYSTALKQAQELGYAEAQPDADVEGWDALAKVIILANVLFDTDLRVQDVPCKGITSLTLEDIQQAAQAGLRWKLIGKVQRKKGSVTASVTPVAIPESDPLAGIGGATNALTFTTDLLGPVTIVGPGAGRLETGYALLSDLLYISLGDVPRWSGIPM